MKWPFGPSGVSRPRGLGDASLEVTLEQALERVVEGTNPRIRAVGGYRKRLLPLLQRALDYAGEVAEGIPGPLPFCRRGWVEDPVVHALFSGVQTLVRAFSHNPELHALFAHDPDLPAAYALLTMRRDETKTFGSEVTGEILTRDVPQVTVGFSEHQVDLPTATETVLRARLRLRIFELLACRAVEEINARESQIRELIETLGKLKSRHALLEEARAAAPSQALPTYRESMGLEQRIAELQQEIGTVRSAFFDLDDYIDVIAAVFAAPERHVALEETCTFLDHFNVRRDAGEDARGQAIRLSQMRLCGQMERVIVIAEFPRAEILPQGLGLEEAERYLR